MTTILVPKSSENFYVMYVTVLQVESHNMNDIYPYLNTIILQILQ